MTQKGKSVTLTLYSSPEGRYHWGGGCPYGHPLGREGSAPLVSGFRGFCPPLAGGFKGWWYRPAGDEFYSPLGGHRPPLETSPSTTSWSPSPRKRWEARLKGVVLSSMLPAHPLSGGWVASAARRKGAAVHSSLFYPFFYGPFDFYADFSKMKVNLPIVETDNMDMTAFKESGSFHVVGQFFFSVVLAPVQFYDQAGLWAVKVTDVVTYDFLSVKAKAVFSKEKIPQFSFFLCHVTSKFFCFFQERAVFRHHVFLIHRSLRMKP